MARRTAKTSSNRKKQTRAKKVLNDSPARWKSILEKYGITKSQYNDILLAQGGACFICLRTPHEIRPFRNLAVDHDHSSGRIRGLLCYSCNHKLLGHSLKDSKEMAYRAWKYLSRKTDYGSVPK